MASQNPPVKGAPYTVWFTLYKNDGSVIPDPGVITKLVAKDGGDYAAATNAVTEVNTTYGRCSLVLTAAETLADHVGVFIKDDTAGCVPFVLEMDTAGQTLDAAVADVQADVDTVFDEVVAVRAVTDNVVSAAHVADAVWDEAATGHTDAGKAGQQLWTDVDAILLKTNTIGATAFTITNPVAKDLTVKVTEGDDYDADHGLQIVIPVADSTHLLGLDEPTAVVKLVAAEAEWTATGVASTAAGYDCTFEPTAAETALLTKTSQDYQVRATLADADVTTRTSGKLVMVAKVA